MSNHKQNNPPSLLVENRKELGTEIKYFLSKGLQYWYLFILALLLGCGLAYIQLRYAVTNYQMEGALLVKSERNDEDLAEEIITDRLGFRPKTSLENEMEIMHSTLIGVPVVSELNLNIDYRIEGNVKTRNLYGESPVQVKLYNLPFGKTFEFQELDSTQFVLKLDTDSWLCMYGDTCAVANGTISVERLGKIWTGEDNKFSISVSDPANTAKSILKRLVLEQRSRRGTIIHASIDDNIPKRGVDIIDKFFEVYARFTTGEKRQSSKNTIDFIDERLRILSKELGNVERTVERFRRNKDISLNLEAKFSQASEQFLVYDQQLKEIQYQLSLLEIVKNNLTDVEELYEPIPTNLGIEGENLVLSITNYNEQISRRQLLLQDVTASHPSVLSIEKNIEDTRTVILKSIDNVRTSLSLRQEQLSDILYKESERLRAVPKEERELLEILRQQKVKESLFVFLLQKREEVALTLASTTSGSKVIEPASVVKKNRLKPSMAYGRMCIFSLGLVIGLLFLKELLNNTVESEEELKRYTSIPLLSKLPQDKRKSPIVVSESSRSVTNEMFRLLRTNLSFLTPDKDKKTKVLAVSSTVSGEGKTFVSINLGLTLAFSGKKVLLVGLDLRKPKLASYLNAKTASKGMTNYLIGEDEMQDIIQQSDLHKKLSFVSSGPIPPNPTELLLLDKIGTFINESEKIFDYVIVDLPPVGLVTDALLIRENIDSYLLVVKSKYTQKQGLKMLEDLYVSGKLIKPNIILNGVSRRSNYGYGYGYGYYEE